MRGELPGIARKRLRRALALCVEAEAAVQANDWPRANQFAAELQQATHALFNTLDLASIDEVSAASVRALRDRLTRLSLTVAQQRDDMTPAVRSARQRRRMNSAYASTA